MNWTWNLRTAMAVMNGLEFARFATTAGGFSRVLVHAAPSQASVEVIADGGAGSRKISTVTVTISPMTLIVARPVRHPANEVGPDESFTACPCCFAGARWRF